MKIIFASFVLMVLPFVFTDKLTGRWQSPVSPKGNVTGIVFKEDKSFEAYVNKKPFVSGKYSLVEDSVFSFVDNGCDGKPGTYRLIFFSNGDSLRMEAISDSCMERKNGMIRLVLGKVK